MITDILKIFKKPDTITFDKLGSRFTVRQQVLLRVHGQPQTYASRIEDWNQDTVSIGGISSDEPGFLLPSPHQKMELFVLTGNQYLKAEVVLKEVVEKPVYLWIVSKPNSFTPHKDRRRHYRLEKVTGALIQEYPNVFQDYDEAVTKNISAGGALIISRDKFDLGARLVIKLPELLKANYQGNVVWKNENPKSGRRSYGIKFSNLNEDDQDRLSRYVNDKLTRDRSLGYYETPQ